MQIKQGFKEFGAFTTTTVLSSGPSQLFGVIKGLVDLIFLIKAIVKRIQLASLEKQIKNHWVNFKSTNQFKIIQARLDKKDISSTEALAFIHTKQRKCREKMARLRTALMADLTALIPLAGAHISWRISTHYKGKSFTPIFSRGLAQMAEHQRIAHSKVLFPLSDKYGAPTADIKIPVKTSTRLRYIEAVSLAPLDNRPTVVLFHGNGHTSKTMVHTGTAYHEKGYQVLAVTIGGYPGSPGVFSSEESLYQDVEAIKIFLNKLGVKEAGYHGLSLGGAGAFQAAAGESQVELKTLFVVADQTFASAYDVAGNLINNFFGPAAPFGRGIMRAALPPNHSCELPGGKWVKTNGLDNLAKARKLRELNIPLFCTKSSQDILMGRNRTHEGYSRNFSDDLIEARYDDPHERAVHLEPLKGGHCTSIPDHFFDNIPDVSVKP